MNVGAIPKSASGPGRGHSVALRVVRPATAQVRVQVSIGESWWTQLGAPVERSRARTDSCQIEGGRQGSVRRFVRFEVESWHCAMAKGRG